jgi:hypothetical protein
MFWKTQPYIYLSFEKMWADNICSGLGGWSGEEGNNQVAYTLVYGGWYTDDSASNEHLGEKASTLYSKLENDPKLFWTWPFQILPHQGFSKMNDPSYMYIASYHKFNLFIYLLGILANYR